MNTPHNNDKWPPLVGAANLPPLIRLRDTLLTAGAWILLAYLMRDAFLLAWDYLSHPIFELTFTTAPDWPALWRRLSPYFVSSGMLVAWLLFWAYISRSRLAQFSYQPQPPCLAAEEHALSLDLPAAQVREWQTKRSVVVNFDAKGSITSVNEHHPVILNSAPP